MEQPPPEVLALVLADHVHRDDLSDKLFILGTRSAIGARSFPWTHPVLAIYAALVDGRGETALRFRLVDADEAREAVAEEETVVTFPDPVTELQVVVFFSDLIFPEPAITGSSCWRTDSSCANAACWSFPWRTPAHRDGQIPERTGDEPEEQAQGRREGLRNLPSAAE